MLPAWVVARLVVLVALVVAHVSVRSLRPGDTQAVLRVHQGLLSWDAGWYESIARAGYAGAGMQSVRFFPALPLAARVAGWLPGAGPGVGVVVVANLAALAGMAVLVLLVCRETGDDALARRAVWLLALAPPAYTLVLGYAEGALLLCTTTAFVALRSGRWWWAAAAGAVAGTVRPVGLLLVVPAAVEATRPWWPGGSRPGLGTVPGRVAAVVAPVVGTGAYLAWVDARYGDPWLPFHVQESPGHRGPVTVPFGPALHDLDGVLHGHHLGEASHLPWVALSLVLLVVAFRRLPVSYGAFSAGVLAVSLTSSNLDSFERYALSAFPLVIAASLGTGRPVVERTVLVVAGTGMAA